MRAGPAHTVSDPLGPVPVTAPVKRDSDPAVGFGLWVLHHHGEARLTEARLTGFSNEKPFAFSFLQDHRHLGTFFMITYNVCFWVKKKKNSSVS